MISMKLNIVFAVDNGGFDMMAVAMYSVIKNNRKHQLTFRVFHKDISKNNILRLKNLEDKYSNVQIIPVQVDRERFRNTKTNNIYVTTEAYFRYLTPEALHSEDRALYMDFDMLCLSDLGDLYKTNLGDNYIGATPDYAVEHDTTYQKFKKSIGFGDGEIYANSGLQLMDLNKLRDSKIMEVFWDNLRHKNDIIPSEYNFFADQTIMNLTFKGKIKFIHSKYNVFTTVIKEMKQINPVIVHFTGLCKPLTYRNKSTSFYDDTYYTYYRECMSIIGDDNGMLLKNTLKKLSDEAGDTPLKLKINNELRIQVEDAVAYIKLLEKRIGDLDAHIIEERRFKNLLRNIALIVDRRITSILGKDRGLYNPIIKVFYVLYRLIRWLLSRIVRFVMNLIKKLRSN